MLAAPIAWVRGHGWRWLRAAPAASGRFIGDHRARLTQLAVYGAVIIVVLLAYRSGLAWRRWAWDQTQGVRYAGDVINAVGWGAYANNVGYLHVYDRMVNKYGPEGQYIGPAIYQLDYAPTRLLIVTLWAHWAADPRHWGGDPAQFRGPVTRWQRPYEFTEPMLQLNTACELASCAAIAVSGHGVPGAGGTTVGGAVNATALNSVYLQTSSADLIAGMIASEAGDVVLTIGGNVFDSRAQTPAETLSQDQLQQVWQNLHLTASLGASALADSHAVVPFQTLIESNYQTYWRFLANGSLQGGQLVLNPTGDQLYTPIAAAAGYATARDYAQAAFNNARAILQNNLGGSFDQVVGTAFNPAFTYTATPDQHDQLAKDVAWTVAQLQNAINESALQPGSGTLVGTAVPNISGRHVTITAAKGLGTLAAPVTVTQSDLQAGNLSPTQAAALALANAPGDVTITGDPLLGNAVITVKQTAPVFLTAIDDFGGSAANGPIYVQANGSLTFNIPGALSAAAGQGLHLTRLGGNLVVGEAFAGDEATLNAPAGDLISQSGYADLNIVAPSIHLAVQGDVGTSSRALKVDDAPSASNSSSSTGSLNIDAGGVVYLFGSQTGDPLVVGTITSGGLQHITSADALTVGSLQSGGEQVLAAADVITVAGGATLSNTSGGISLSGTGIQMGADSQIDATGAASLSALAGDIVLGKVASGLTSGLALNLSASGSITGNGDGQVNLTAPAGAQTQLQAGSGIGSAMVYLLTDVPELTAQTTQGGIYLHNQQSLETSSISAPQGNVGLQVDGTLDFETIAAGTDATVSVTGSVTGDQFTADGNASLNSTAGDVTVQHATASGDLNMQAAGDLMVHEGQVGGAAELTAGGAMQGDGLTTGGNMALTAVDDLNVGLLTSGGDMSLTSSAGAIDATGTLSAHGSMELNAALGITLASIDSDSGFNLHTSGSLSITGPITSHGDLNFDVGGDLTLQSLTTTQSVQLTSQTGSIDFTSLTAADGVLQAAAAISFQQAFTTGSDNG